MSHASNTTNSPKSDSLSIINKFKSWLFSYFKVTNNNPFTNLITELVEKFDDKEQKELTLDERLMIQNIFSFRIKKADDIMIPRTDIIAARKDISFDELKAIFIKHEHTRMPIYDNSLDNIIGFIHVKDLIPILAHEREFIMDQLIRELLIISPAMKIIDLLAKMRASRVHMALVLDEYGGTDGLVTIEDLVEEIVGEIQDEHDDKLEPDYILFDDQTIEASARLSIEKLEELTKMNILDEDLDDFDTLGGLILSIVSYVPNKGEKIIHPSGLEFTILDSDPRKIKRIMIKKPEILIH